MKKEQWDISMYSKLSRDVGSQYDFEPRSTSKEVRGVRRGSKRRSSDRKKEASKENKKSSSGSKSHVSALQGCVEFGIQSTYVRILVFLPC